MTKLKSARLAGLGGIATLIIGLFLLSTNWNDDSSETRADDARTAHESSEVGRADENLSQAKLSSVTDAASGERTAGVASVDSNPVPVPSVPAEEEEVSEGCRVAAMVTHSDAGVSYRSIYKAKEVGNRQGNMVEGVPTKVFGPQRQYSEQAFELKKDTEYEVIEWKSGLAIPLVTDDSPEQATHLDFSSVVTRRVSLYVETKDGSPFDGSVTVWNDGSRPFDWRRRVSPSQMIDGAFYLRLRPGKYRAEVLSNDLARARAKFDCTESDLDLVVDIAPNLWTKFRLSATERGAVSPMPEEWFKEVQILDPAGEVVEYRLSFPAGDLLNPHAPGEAQDGSEPRRFSHGEYWLHSSGQFTVHYPGGEAGRAGGVLPIDLPEGDKVAFEVELM